MCTQSQLFIQCCDIFTNVDLRSSLVLLTQKLTNPEDPTYKKFPFLWHVRLAPFGIGDPRRPRRPQVGSHSWWLPTCHVWFTCANWYGLQALPIPLFEEGANICTCTARAICIQVNFFYGALKALSKSTNVGTGFGAVAQNFTNSQDPTQIKFPDSDTCTMHL